MLACECNSLLCTLELMGDWAMPDNSNIVCDVGVVRSLPLSPCPEMHANLVRSIERLQDDQLWTFRLPYTAWMLFKSTPDISGKSLQHTILLQAIN